MKKNELLSALRSLQSGKGRTSLAEAVGVLAMLLLLLLHTDAVRGQIQQ